MTELTAHADFVQHAVDSGHALSVVYDLATRPSGDPYDLNDSKNVDEIIEHIEAVYTAYVYLTIDGQRAWAMVIPFDVSDHETVADWGGSGKARAFVDAWFNDYFERTKDV